MSDPRLHITDAQGRRVLRLDRPHVLIGRRGTADVQISGHGVSREHAEIVRENGRFLLRDRSRFGTLVNGEPISERLLTNGDRIILGKSGTVELVFLTESSSTGILGTTSSRDQLGLLAALLEALRALGSGGVLDEVLALVIDSAIQVTGAERGFIMLANRDGNLELTIARGRGRTTLSGSSFITSEKIPREVFRTGQTAMIDDLADDVDHARTRAVGIRQVRCVPLRVTPMKTSAETVPGSRVIGVLYLDSRQRSTLTTSTQSSLEAFATQAAMAIDNARLYGESAEKQRIEQELRLAAQYQHTLFPEAIFEGATVDLAASSIPCRTIGGDFFEYVELAAGAFGFALGDVAGKGPPAALLATAVQAHFEAQASVAANPAEAMTRLNAVLLRRAIEARFATMFYGVVTPEGTLTYCNAGHEPPILITGTGISQLESGGPVLGLLPVASYDMGTCHLDRGDVVVVCTDGVTEARSTTGEEFGQTRLVDAVRDCHGAKPEAVLEQVMGAVRRFSEGEVQGDDVTALVMRYRGRTG